MTVRAALAGQRASVFVQCRLPHGAKPLSIVRSALWIAAVAAVLASTGGGVASAETPAATPLEAQEKALEAMPPHEVEARRATFDCMVRAAKALFLQTAKARRETPSLVHQNFANGFYAQEVREACSAAPRIALHDDDTIKRVIESTAFRDWLKAENDRWHTERAKEDQWFFPLLERQIREYVHCMRGGSLALATISDEPAETVVTATRVACKPKLDELRQTHRKYADALARIDDSVGFDGPGTVRELMEEAETLIKEKQLDMHDELLLAIIKERARRRSEQEAQPPSPPSPESKAHETPL
jgi:hypothetical protein